MRPIYDIQEFQASILIGGQMLHIKKYKYFHLMRKLLLLPTGLQLVSVPVSEELSVITTSGHYGTLYNVRVLLKFAD